MNSSSQQTVRITRAEILYALEFDDEFFVEFFMGDKLTVPIPNFHLDALNIMTHAPASRCAFAIPRAFAKTTIAKLAAVRHFLFSKYRFIIYVSAAAEDLAIPAVSDIISFMQCENFRSVFGELEFIINQAGNGLYKFRIPAIDKVCILRAFGVQKSIRGINVDNERPELAILDDIETRENIHDERLFKKLKTWVYATLFKALNQFDNKVIHLGNMIYGRSLLAMHVKSKLWYSRLYGCILANGKPLWEELWPISRLREDYKNYQEVGEADNWLVEMMNRPTPPGGGIIKSDQITYLPPCLASDIEYGFITVDLASSDASWAHETAVVVHGWIPHAECWQIVEYNYWTGIDPIQLFNEIIALLFKWRLNVVGIEDTAFQAVLKHVYRYLALERGLEQISFVPVFSFKAHKSVKIITWAGQLKTGHYALTEGDFVCTQQLLDYDPMKKKNADDVIDAASFGDQMKSNYMTEILNRNNPSIKGEFVPIVNISPV